MEEIISHKLVFQSKTKEEGDIYSFDFKMEEPITWCSGQYGVFSFESRTISERPMRTFSIASAPSEKIVKLGMRIPDTHSEFKDAMLNLQVGERLNMRGPFGEFCVTEPGMPHIFMAGGIGITPIRAIFQDMVQKKYFNGQFILLYSQNQGIYAFREDLNKSAQDAGNIRINYIIEIEDFNKKLEGYCKSLGNNARYFVSGAPAMVESVKDKLNMAGIEISNIKFDPFMGY